MTVTAKNSYTIHYRVHQIVLADEDTALEIKSVESEVDPVLSWNTKFLGVEENAFVYSLELTTESLEKWKEDLAITCKQNQAEVQYEMCDRNGYSKKVTISASGARKTIYYVCANRSERWDLAQLKIDGQLYKEEQLEKEKENAQVIWNINMPIPNGKKITVVPKFSEVEARVEDSDRPEYEKKVVLQYKEESQIAYLSFQDSGLGEPGILKLYQNGKNVDWGVQKRMVDGTQITEILLDEYQSGDDLQVVPYTDSTTVEIKDSTYVEFEKELTLKDGEKSRTYYVAVSEDTDDLCSDLEKIVLERQVYTTKETAEEAPYFYVDTEKKELRLYGEKKPLDWKKIQFQFSDSEWTEEVKDFVSDGEGINVTFTRRKQSQTYAVRWMLSNDVWEITSVKEGGIRKAFSYDTQEDVTYEERRYDPNGKKLLIYGVATETDRNFTIVPKNQATEAVIEGTHLTLIYTDGTERYTRQIQIQTQEQEKPKETSETWEMESIQIGEKLYVNGEKEEEDFEEPECYFVQGEDILEIYGLQEQPQGEVQVKMRQKNGAIATVQQKEKNVDGAYICLDYQGKKKYLQIQYQIKASIWNIQAIKMDQTDVTFSVSENEIAIYSKTAKLGENIQIHPENKEVEVQNIEDCRIGNAQKRVELTYKGYSKTFFIKTEFPIEEEKDTFRKVNEFFVGKQKFVVKQGGADHYFIYDHDQIFLYGTSDWTEEQLTGADAPEWKVTSQIAGTKVKVENTTKEGYLKRITMQYKGYLQVYYVAYDLEPALWKVQKIQTKSQTYTTDQKKKAGYFSQIKDDTTNMQSLDWITTEKQPDIQSVTCVDAKTTCTQKDITYDADGIPVSLVLHRGKRTKMLRLHTTLPNTYWEITEIKTKEKTYNNNENTDEIENSETGCRWSVAEKDPQILSVTTMAGTFSISEKEILYKNQIPCGFILKYGNFQKILPLQCELSSDLLLVDFIQTSTGITYQVQKEGEEQEGGTFIQEGNFLCLIGTEEEMPEIKIVKMQHQEIKCESENIELDEKGKPQAFYVLYGKFRIRVDLYYEKLE